MPQRPLFRALAALLIIAMLGACERRKTIHTDVGTFNFTDHVITSAWINNAWVGNVRTKEGGGSVCCVALPRVYQPGYTITVDWERYDCISSISECFYKYKSGEWPIKTLQKTLTIPPYTDKSAGELQLVFLPGDEIRVYASMLGLGHPQHQARAEFGDLLAHDYQPLEGIWPSPALKNTTRQGK